VFVSGSHDFSVQLLNLSLSTIVFSHVCVELYMSINLWITDLLVWTSLRQTCAKHCVHKGGCSVW